MYVWQVFFLVLSAKQNLKILIIPNIEKSFVFLIFFSKKFQESFIFSLHFQKDENMFKILNFSASKMDLLIEIVVA